MTTKKLLTAVSLLCLSLAIGFAQGPNGSKTYYQAANGKSGAALKTALHKIITISSAGWSYDGLKEAYKTTDTRADGNICVIGILMLPVIHQVQTVQGGSYGERKVMDITENILFHRVGFEKASPMKSDISGMLFLLMQKSMEEEAISL